SRTTRNASPGPAHLHSEKPPAASPSPRLPLLGFFFSPSPTATPLLATRSPLQTAAAAAMVRLNADLIWKSPHFFNAIKERELDLRGNKIAIIENIGATEVSSATYPSFLSL
uniref:Uncharacterized protein n=1 Tax=Aegilops tauschii subsp. strangulata TaxID=200361 RepID=A0A453MJ78_AEGTS